MCCRDSEAPKISTRPNFILRTDHKVLVRYFHMYFRRRRNPESNGGGKNWVVLTIQWSRFQVKKNRWLIDFLDPLDQFITMRFPMKEEFVINEILKRHGGQVPEYSVDLMKVTRAIMDDDLNESVRLEFHETFRLRDELTLNEGLTFYRAMGFLPEVGNRGEILEAGHGLYLGITRSRNRIQEVFW